MKPLLPIKRPPTVKPKGQYHGTKYAQCMHEPATLKEVVNGCVKRLQALQKTHPFNALAGCGHSGLVVGSIVAWKLGLPLITVRKTGDLNHDFNYHKVSGFLPEGEPRWEYIIIDDLIESGDSIRHVVSQVEAFSASKPDAMRKAKAVGVLLYRCNWRDGKEQSVDVPGSKPLRIWYRKERVDEH